MAIMTIQWVTKDDVRVCPVCRPHHGFMWSFDTEKEAFPTRLFSHIGGYPMWDAVLDKSMIHLQLRNQGKGIPCRCILKVAFDVQTLNDYLLHLTERALEMHGQLEQWSTGQVTVLRHEGRFVSWRKA